MKSVPVRVLALSSVEHPRVVASADVQVGDIVLKDVRLIQDAPGDALRLQGPQVSWTDESSVRHYASPCKLHKPLRKAIVAAVVERLRSTGGAR